MGSKSHIWRNLFKALRSIIWRQMPVSEQKYHLNNLVAACCRCLNHFTKCITSCSWDLARKNKFTSDVHLSHITYFEGRGAVTNQATIWDDLVSYDQRCVGVRMPPPHWKCSCPHQCHNSIASNLLFIILVTVLMSYDPKKKSGAL